MSPVTEISESKISEAKLEANRANAQLSTGPATPEGKKQSAKNAWRHGMTGQVALMPHEDAVEFNRFTKAIVADFHPEGAIENQLAQSIAEDFWRLNRGRAWETNTLAIGFFDGTENRIDADHPQINDAMTQALVFEKQAGNFGKIALYETRLNRNIAKNEERLKLRQAERRAALAQAVEEARLLADEPDGHAAIAASGDGDRPGLIATEAETKSTVRVAGFVFSTTQIHQTLHRQQRLEAARQRHLQLQKAA
jgi:hypothetical protein